jgi:hypothetical protein
VYGSQRMCCELTTVCKISVSQASCPARDPSNVGCGAAAPKLVTKSSSSRHHNRGKIPALKTPAPAPATKRRVKSKPYVDVNSDEYVTGSEEELEVLEVPASRTTRAQARGGGVSKATTDAAPTSSRASTSAPIKSKVAADTTAVTHGTTVRKSKSKATSNVPPASRGVAGAKQQ